MNSYFTLLLTFCINFAICRDFYVGMFKKNDILVAQDRLYRERVPYRMTFAKYGRHFKCPITYFRVVDRLGMGRGPRVEIIRGGLRKQYIVLRLTSPYNLPISVNIYVGCENKMTTTKRITTTTPKADREGDTTAGGNDTTVSEGDDTGNGTTAAGDEESDSSGSTTEASGEP